MTNSDLESVYKISELYKKSAAILVIAMMTRMTAMTIRKCECNGMLKLQSREKGSPPRECYYVTQNVHIRCNVGRTNALVILVRCVSTSVANDYAECAKACGSLGGPS